MRKGIAFLLCLILLAAPATGCALKKAEQPQEPAATAQQPRETEPEDAAEPVEEEPEAGSHYVFQPKVCSSFLEDVFGGTMCETWFNLVDAVMAGEDTFACPDKETFDWVMGQFPGQCFPLLTVLIDYPYDRENPVTDGMAYFTYKVPKEEAAKQISEFAQLIEGILNETLKDDYSDFEKALALYVYVSHTYVYDDEAAAYEGYDDSLSSYRVLTTGTGICREIANAYSYLLLQAGVDASNMSGHNSYDPQGHQWSYVRINGHNFHIDPTYAIGEADALMYFMMDDGQREAAGGFFREDFLIASNYAQDHPHPDYAADDDTFSAIWNGYYAGFDHGTRTLYYEEYDGVHPTTVQSFDYTGW